MRTDPRRPLTSAALCLVVAGLAPGCSSGPSEADCPTPSAAPAADLALLPAGLSLEGVGTVTKVVSTRGHVTVQAVTTKPLDEVTVAIQDAVAAAGFRPAGMDNEGFEAEVFFTAGSYAAGQALVRAADCEGRWDVDLVLVDPSQLPDGAASPAASASASPAGTSPGTSPTPG